MADVRPIPGLRYREPLGPVLAPPYDVIPEDELESWRSRSPHNVIRLTRPGDDYAGAARTFQGWIAGGLLAEDEPSMYIHETEFGGRERRDLLAGLRLQPFEDRIVLPHERTHRGPKEDRLALLRATHASLEPLWFLYEGAGGELPALLAEGTKAAADVEFEFGGERHRLWRIAAGAWTSSVSAALAALPVLIADGHHRYETTLAFSRELGGGPDAASRFTLALLTDLDDPGLVVLPTHRVLRSGVAVTGGRPAASLGETLEAIEGRVAAGCYRGGGFQVLELEGEEAVVELHRQVVDNILGRRTAEEMLIYTRDAAEAVGWVDEGRGVAAFLLGTPDVGAVLNLAREGKTMPQKSTYFHPKPPSGMLFHRLDSERAL